MEGKKGFSSGRRKDVQLVEQKKLGLNEQIKDLEDEIAKTKYNKRTQRAIGLMKAKLALMKEKSEHRGGSGKSKGDERFSVRKTGDGTAVLLGFPSVGKSTLLNALTGAKSAIAAYAFTTLSAVPGLMKYNHAKIQIVDVPGVVEGAASGRGRGGEVLSLLRSSDLILILVDALYPEHYQALLGEVYDSGVRLNKRKPDVVISKKIRGGLSVSSLVRMTKMNKEVIESVAREFKMINADLLFKEDIDVDEFIDVLRGNCVYIKALTVITKADLVDKETMDKICQEIKPDVIISAEKNQGIEELKKAIYDKLDLIRIFLKEINKKPDLEEPLIMSRGCTIRDVCSKLHKDFVDKFKFARVWGPSAKYDGQQFHKMDKVLQDKDVLELHIR